MPYRIQQQDEDRYEETFKVLSVWLRELWCQQSKYMAILDGAFYLDLSLVMVFAKIKVCQSLTRSQG